MFPPAEQDVVLATIEPSVVFVTGAEVDPLLLNRAFDGAAWMLARY